MNNNQKTSVLKAISWRIIATGTTMILAYIFTGQIEMMKAICIGDIILKMTFYFIHERAWNIRAFKGSKTISHKASLQY